jgi:hypothetical protein
VIKRRIPRGAQAHLDSSQAVGGRWGIVRVGFVIANAYRLDRRLDSFEFVQYGSECAVAAFVSMRMVTDRDLTCLRTLRDAVVIASSATAMPVPMPSARKAPLAAANPSEAGSRRCCCGNSTYRAAFSQDQSSTAKADSRNDLSGYAGRVYVAGSGYVGESVGTGDGEQAGAEGDQ